MFKVFSKIYIPIPSMYGIFTYIWLNFMVNVGKYTIHVRVWDNIHPTKFTVGAFFNIENLHRPTFSLEDEPKPFPSSRLRGCPSFEPRMGPGPNKKEALDFKRKKTP